MTRNATDVNYLDIRTNVSAFMPLPQRFVFRRYRLFICFYTSAVVRFQLG